MKDKDILLEYYAVERKDFVGRAKGLFFQIAENLDLINYLRLKGLDSEYINHWKTEIIAHVTNISEPKIKGNNSVETRHKAVIQLYNSNNFLSNTVSIRKHLEKFKKEKIMLDYNLIDETEKATTEQMYHIATYIALDNKNELIDYIGKI